MQACRPTGMKTALRVGAGLAGALLLTGCGSASTGAGPRGTPSASTPPSTAGLRGTPVAKVSCTSGVNQPAKNVQPLHAAPIRIVICPLHMPGAGGPATELAPPPQALVRALSLPDRPKQPGTYACAAYADVPQVVYAQTAGGHLYQLWVPIERSCGHYLPAAVQALDQYAHQSPMIG